MWENQSAHISADAGNVLTEGTDGLAYFSGIATGAGAPTATNPANPNPGDIYVDEATGDIYTYTSATEINTPTGFMYGSYQMLDENSKGFNAVINKFKLIMPRVLH